MMHYIRTLLVLLVWCASTTQILGRWHIPSLMALQKTTHQDAGTGMLQRRGRSMDEGTRPTLGIVSMVKDDSLDIFEWIEHHIGIGVTKFFIYDNNSQKPLSILLQRYIDRGYVRVMNMTLASDPSKKQYIQPLVYTQALREHWQEADWLAFFDADEFLFMTNPSDTHIGDVLRDYDQYSALGVNWMMYSSSDFKYRPLGGLRANYHKCLPIDHKEHKHIKTIAHTSKAGVAQDLCFEGPHSLQKHPNHTVVDELKRDVVGPFTKTPSHTRLALLHYVLRSRQDFELKRERGSAQGNHKPWGFFDIINLWSDNECTKAQEYVRALRQQQEPPLDLNKFFQDFAAKVGATINEGIDTIRTRRRRM